MGKLFNVFLVVLNILLTAFALSTLWGWFVVPIGVNAISMAQAFGLSLIVVYFQVRNKPILKPEMIVKIGYRRRLLINLGMSTMSLAIGYVTTLFM